MSSGRPWNVSSRVTRTTAGRGSAWPESIGNLDGDRAKDCLAPLPESDADATASSCAEVEFDRGDIDAVKRLLADGPPDHRKLARLRGHLALNRQDGAEAVRCFCLSDAAEPNHGETLYGLAQAAETRRAIGPPPSLIRPSRRSPGRAPRPPDEPGRQSRTQADRLLPACFGLRVGRVLARGWEPGIVSPSPTTPRTSRPNVVSSASLRPAPCRRASALPTLERLDPERN